MNLSSGARVGPYEILAPLGAGGMGEVYRARDPRLGRDVAVKVLPASYSTDPDRLARFEREARAASRLDHPNILVIHDIGMHEGAPYIVSELLEGETLGNRLASGPIPVRKAVECALQIAQGLAAAHEKGIVHRDLKPANLFLTKDGRAKILDFGLAKLVQLEDASTLTHAHGTPAETEPGVVLGTIGYMAPEQVRGLPADHRSDIFAFGAVLYEMLSGRRAFQAQSVADIMSAILKQDPPALRAMNPNITPTIELIVRHCLEKEPVQRFQNASDLAFNLEAASRGSAEVPTGPSSSRPARTSRQRAKLVAFMILTVVAATSLALLAAMQVKLNELNGRPARVNYQRLTFQRGAVSAARFAPDGKTIYYTATWDGRPMDLFETQPGEVASQPMGLTRSHLLSISSTGTIALSMDDDQFIYTAASRLGTLGELPITGGTPHRILEDVRSADWSPDGKTLAVVHNVEGTDRLEMPPGSIIYRTAGWINALRISPSGQWLAFVEKTSPPNVRGKVVIMDARGKIAAKSPEWRALEGLAWSADGEEVWFSAAGDNVCFDLRTLSPDGRERVVERFPG